MGIFNIIKRYIQEPIKITEIEDNEGLAYYKSRLYSGMVIERFENGNKKRLIEFSKGIPKGKMIDFYENGRIMIDSNIKDGNPDGVTKSYREDGSLEYILKFEKQHLITRTKYYPSGKVRTITRYKFVSQYNDDVPHGIEYTYSEEGKIIGSANWEDGLPNGSFGEIF